MHAGGGGPHRVREAAFRIDADRCFHPGVPRAPFCVELSSASRLPVWSFVPLGAGEDRRHHHRAGHHQQRLRGAGCVDPGEDCLRRAGSFRPPAELGRRSLVGPVCFSGSSPRKCWKGNRPCIAFSRRGSLGYTKFAGSAGATAARSRSMTPHAGRTTMPGRDLCQCRPGTPSSSLSEIGPPVSIWSGNPAIEASFGDACFLATFFWIINFKFIGSFSEAPNLLGDLFERIRDDLGQCGVIPWCAE